MINIKEETIMVGTSELRTEMPKIAEAIKVKHVILTKKGKPIAVIQDYNSYNEREKLLDEYEDYVLGNLAKIRDKREKGGHLTHEELIKKLGLV